MAASLTGAGKSAALRTAMGLRPIDQGPRLGKKQVFLPNFVITLLRTPEKPAHIAQFIVPLNFNKLDLRDYLYNGYGVRVHSVRSFIQQQKIQQDKPGAIRPRQRRWYRPRAIKKMMVELDRPFVWPAEPEDYSPWDKDLKESATKESDSWHETLYPDYAKTPTRERKPMEEQAQEYLQGKRKWMSYDEEMSSSASGEGLWEDVGEAKEVEQDVVVPKS